MSIILKLCIKAEYSECSKDPNCFDDYDSQENKVQQDFSKDNIIKNYSNYHYDTYWNCYCKYQKIFSCGCNSDHDGW